MIYEIATFVFSFTGGFFGAYLAFRMLFRLFFEVKKDKNGVVIENKMPVVEIKSEVKDEAVKFNLDYNEWLLDRRETGEKY